MTEIMPFRGILYNREKIKDIKKVVTPPYDVIAPDEQERYYNKHENNIIRLILPRRHASDTDEENRYTEQPPVLKAGKSREFSSGIKRGPYISIVRNIPSKRKKER